MHETSKQQRVGGSVAVQRRSRAVEPGKRTLTEAEFGTGAVVQARAGGAEPAAAVHAAAERGLVGAPGALPHGQTIQRLFGRHDVSGIRAHVGGAATEACESMGATAYASGESVAFAGAPDLHTAAHEAAHIVQQRGGVQLKGGVGQAGDPYEQHADAVADRVVRGESAADLLDGHGAAGQVQRKPADAKQAACTECGGAPAGTGDCPACKATQALQALPALSGAPAVQRKCDPSIASCPFEEPGASSSSEPNASSAEPNRSEPTMSGGDKGSTAPPVSASSSGPRWPNQTCPNEVLDALQAAMHAACDIGQSTCSPSKVSQKKLDRLNCNEVAERLARNRACLDARRLIQTTCFGGIADERHIGPLDAAERAVEHCETLLRRCRQREQERQQPRTVPNLERVIEVLAILGLSLVLAAAIVAALLDPEPASKVALAVGSAALAVIILERLGIEPEPGFEGA